MEAWLENVWANKEKTNTIVEPYKWAPCVKALHVLTALLGLACSILQGAPKGDY